jgi:hypothetical protein
MVRRPKVSMFFIIYIVAAYSAVKLASPDTPERRDLCTSRDDIIVPACDIYISLIF